MRKKTEKKLKLKRVCARVFMKHKIVASLFSVLLMASAVFTGIECTQALQWGEYWESDWFKHGHNWVVLNALELLERDGYGAEAETLWQYIQDIVNGAVDADIGTVHHGGNYGVSEDNQYNMYHMGGTPFDGGGLAHFFDPWTHHGIGPTEDLWEFVALGAPLVLLTGHIGIVFSAPIIAEVEGWRNWFGKNAAEAAGRAFNRAVNSWNRGDYDRAMYFLGMCLHVLTDVAAVPHHAACILLDGHAEYEEFVEDELKSVLPDTLEAALAANTLYNIGDTDHGIYLEDLRSLSDGVYIAGDTDQLTDTGSDIEGLRKGHIYQLPNAVHQFIDFAAHESIEWYPMANSDVGTDDFDDWWELWNYIEAPDLQKKRQGNQPDDNHVSRLIFHFEGVNTVTADFEGAMWHNWEAIDMENWWFKQLGYVSAWEGYDMDWMVGGPWVSEGGLTWGPEPTAYGTLQLETVVERGLNSLDKDCDGWQLSEIRVEDMVYPWSGYLDPLTREHDPTTRTYCIDSNGVWKALPLLDEDLVPDDMHSTAQRIAAVHLMDLAYKLCTGMIEYFFDQVDFEPVGIYPRTYLGSYAVVDNEMGPNGIMLPSGPYFDENGRCYFGDDGFALRVSQGRSVWDGNQKRYVTERVGDGIRRIYYRIDDGDWITIPPAPHGGYPSETEFPRGDCYSCYVPWWGYGNESIPLPDDGLPHVVSFYSENWEGLTDTPKSYIIVGDTTRPTTETSFGKPSALVNGVWYITPQTPIILNASDQGGSGIFKTAFRIYSEDEGKYVLCENPQFPIQMTVYTCPFTLCARAQLLTEEALPAGTYTIEFSSTDNIGWWEGLGWVGDQYGYWQLKSITFELVDYLEGVIVDVNPYSCVIQPGSTRTYNISVTNMYQTTQTYDLTVEGLDPTWLTFPETSVTIGPDETANVTLTVSPPYSGLVLKDYPFTVTASLQDSPEVSDTAEAILILIFQPDPPAEPEGSVEVDVEPEPIPVGSAATASVHVVNNQNFDDLIALSIDVDDIPENDQADLTWFNWGGIQIFAPAGSTTTVSLTITVPDDASIGYRMFDVTAKSRTLPSARATIRVRMGNYPEHALQEIQHLREDIASLLEDGTIDPYKHDRILASLAQIEADINSAIDYLDEIRHGFDDKVEGLSALKSAASRTEYLIKDLRNWVSWGYMSNDLANEIIQHLESISAAMAYKADYEAQSEKMLAVAAIEDAETRGRQVPWLSNQISYIDMYLADGDYWLAEDWISKAVSYYKTAFYYSQRIVINAWHWSWGTEPEDWIDQLEENL